MTEPSQNRWSIVERQGREGLLSLEEAWRRITCGMPLRTVFHCFDAHLSYIDHLAGAPEHLRYLALSDDGEIRGICPLEGRVDRTVGLPAPVWAIPCHPHWPLADVVATEDEARRAFLPALLEHLRQHPEGRPLVVLGPLPENSALWAGLDQFDSRLCCAHASDESHYLDCSHPYDEVAQRLSKSFRRHLRSERRRLEALSDVRFMRATDAEDVAREFEAFLAVEASGWKGSSGTGSAILLHPELVRFYRQLGSMADPDGHCEIDSLYADGRCIASQFSVRSGGHLTSLKTAYDETYARFGPGQILKQHVFQRCCEDPAVERLNLVSNATWHHKWQPRSVKMQQSHLSIGAWQTYPLCDLLTLRYGVGRRVVRGLRARREES